MEKFEGKYIITPHVGIDNIKFGMSRDEVHTLLEGYVCYRRNSGTEHESDIEFYDEIKLIISFDLVNTVCLVDCYNQNLSIEWAGKIITEIRNNPISKVKSHFNLSRTNGEVYRDKDTNIAFTVTDKLIKHVSICTQKYENLISFILNA
jgi:hypothetical protein